MRTTNKMIAQRAGVSNATEHHPLPDFRLYIRPVMEHPVYCADG